MLIYVMNLNIVLKLLQYQGMPPDKLRVVAYTLPAWGGFMSAELIGKVDAMFRRLMFRCLEI